MDSRCFPANIRRLHLSDELPYFGINGRPALLAWGFDSSNANKNESPADASARRYRGALRATLTDILLHIARTGPKTGGQQEILADASPMVLALRVAVGALNSPASIDDVT